MSIRDASCNAGTAIPELVPWKPSRAALLRRTNMQKYLIAAMLVANFVAPVMAAEAFYIILDKTLKGCTIATTEPTDKTRYKVLGKYNSETEAEKAISAMKDC
jgi:hypothetical protein